MRSLHLRRRTAALLLVPALLAVGALHAEHPVPSLGPEPAAASIGRSVGGSPAPWAEPEQDSQAPQPIATSRSRTRSLDPVGESRPSISDRGRAALASLSYDWQALGYEVRFRPYDGRGLGSANRQTRLITVYVRPGQSDLSLRVSLAHELGHALDFEHGTTSRRDSYRRIRGLAPTGAWFPCDRCDDYASPAGDFAEVFALWLVGPGDFRSRLKGPPGRQQLRDLSPLFELPRSEANGRPSPSAAPSPEPDQDEGDEEDDGLGSVLDPLPSPPPGA